MAPLFFFKPRPPYIPGGVRGPYDPHKLTRNELLLLASLKARTPQHAERVIKRTGRRAAVLALEIAAAPRIVALQAQDARLGS